MPRRQASRGKKASGPASAVVLNARSKNHRIWLPPTPRGRPVLARTCHKCGHLLMETDYYDKGDDCATCRNDRRRAETWANAERPWVLLHSRAIPVAATCNRCDQIKLADEFYWGANGLPNTSLCKPCSNKRSQEYEDNVLSRVRAETRANAHRSRYQWTGPELETASRRDLSAREVAVMLGRSYAAVNTMRARLKAEPQLRHVAGVADA